MTFLDHLGLPQMPPFKLSDSLIDWVEAIAHIKRHIDKDIIIGFDVMADPVNNTINRISVGMPGDSSPLPRSVSSLFIYYVAYLSKPLLL